MTSSDSVNERARFTSAEDKKLLELLQGAIAAKMANAEYYARLAAAARSPREKEILEQVRLDELKHERLLRHIYKKMSGRNEAAEQPHTMEPDINHETKPISRSLQAEYERSVFSELEGADFYKKIYISFMNLDIRDMLYDIVTDEQSHAVKLTYLCSNNGRV